MQFPTIPELEVWAVQIAVFLLLILSLIRLLVAEWYRLKRKWLRERQRIDLPVNRVR